MTVEFDLSEVDRLADELGRAGPRVRRAAPKSTTEVAGRLRDDARTAAPVATGRLRSSIEVQEHGDDRLVVATAPYALFVEFGTSNIGPHPFMWPAADTADGRLEKAIEDLADPFD